MTTEQDALLQKARESLEAARILADKDMYDFSVSRAYYAMFYVAEAVLLSKDLLFSKHSTTIAAFGQHFVKTGLIPAHFHRALLDAQEDRLVGDYDFRSHLTRSDADKQINAAETFLAFANEYLSHPIE